MNSDLSTGTVNKKFSKEVNKVTVVVIVMVAHIIL